jgi:hypothetical protein
MTNHSPERVNLLGDSKFYVILIYLKYNCLVDLNLNEIYTNSNELIDRKPCKVLDFSLNRIEANKKRIA